MTRLASDALFALLIVLGIMAVSGQAGIGGAVGSGGVAASGPGWELGEKAQGGVGPGGHYPRTEIGKFCKPHALSVVKFSSNFLYNARTESWTTLRTTLIAPGPANPPAPDPADPEEGW